MWLVIYYGAIPTSGVFIPPVVPLEIAGTGPERGDGRRGGLLYELRLQELNRVKDVGIQETVSKVRAVREEQGQDADEEALIIYWLSEDY